MSPKTCKKVKDVHYSDINLVFGSDSLKPTLKHAKMSINLKKYWNADRNAFQTKIILLVDDTQWYNDK